MKVYRYEDSNRIGPYYHCTIESLDVMLDDHENRDDRPAWVNDFDETQAMELSDHNIDNLRSGCISITALRSWFWGYNVLLKQEGFIIKEYDVPDSNIIYGRSGKQLIFKHI